VTESYADKNLHSVFPHQTARRSKTRVSKSPENITLEPERNVAAPDLARK
jgi:hypothetical protein